MSNHTKAPWEQHNQSITTKGFWEGAERGTDAQHICTVNLKNPAWQANAARIVDCVNACEGIENPAGLKAFISELKKADMCSELRNGLSEALAALRIK